MGLASFDALFLLCAIATFGLPTVSPSYKTDFFIHVMPITYGLTHTTRVGSVFATVSVTLERFFAIVFPFKDVNRLKKFLIPSTVVFTIIYNIPKFFEVRQNSWFFFSYQQYLFSSRKFSKLKLSSIKHANKLFSLSRVFKMQINSNFQEVLGPLGTKFTLHKCGAKYYPPKRIRNVTFNQDTCHNLTRKTIKH